MKNLLDQPIYKAAEFLWIFVILPVSFTIPYNFWIKFALTLIGLIYVILILFRHSHISFDIKKDIKWKRFWLYTFLKFIIISILIIGFVYWQDPAHLFYVPRHHVGLFSIMLVAYTVISVWPQEIIYRTFFFTRYAEFFSNKKLLIFVNSVIFSLAHLFFRNTLVIVITFLGGLLFACTYFYTRSTTLASIEHAIYGNWLFTVGMGDILGFPGMDVT